MVHPFLGFWQEIPRPIIGLSPMDGVTDFAFRMMIARHGKPDVIFTEFVAVDGLLRAPEKILRDLEYTEAERPIVAQLFGAVPDGFYKAAHIICELGFDGIDINMGCPARQVIRKNGGGQLIASPDLALEILRATDEGVRHWGEGRTLRDLKLPDTVTDAVSRITEREGRKAARGLIPCSVKTRIGIDSVIVEKWVERLLEGQPAVISVHGRTLKQGYRGAADWGAIGRAVTTAKGSGTLILGNGDLGSPAEARHRIEETGADGALIGRGSIGNPWIFREKEPSAENRIQWALDHARYFDKNRGERPFRAVRRHLAGYLRHLPGAASLRSRAVMTNDLGELERLLTQGEIPLYSGPSGY